jgi:3-methylcrotonyl-CoA carboxylase alpha subunit
LPDEALVAAALYDSTNNGEAQRVGNGYLSAFDVEAVNPWKTLGPWRMIGEAERLTYMYEGQEHSVALYTTVNDTEQRRVQVDKQPVEEVAALFGNDDLVLLRYGAKQVRAHVQRSEEGTDVALHGQMKRLKRRQPPDVETAGRGSNPASAQKALKAPMAGTVVRVQVHDGEQVKQHQVLVILSAMKMEHSIAAPYEGRVKRVYYPEGTVVKGGATLVEME